MYSVHTTDKSFESKSARAAAEVACNWKRRGMNPKAWASRIACNGYEATELSITTIKETAAAMVAAAK